MAGVKSVITNQINEFRKTPGAFVLQSIFHDHIIRNEQELIRIRQYIKNNPYNWEYDKLNTGTGNRVIEMAEPVRAIHELPRLRELPSITNGLNPATTLWNSAPCPACLRLSDHIREVYTPLGGAKTQVEKDAKPQTIATSGLNPVPGSGDPGRGRSRFADRCRSR
jgi:hypothetical protein